MLAPRAVLEEVEGVEEAVLQQQVLAQEWLVLLGPEGEEEGEEGALHLEQS